MTTETTPTTPTTPTTQAPHLTDIRTIMLDQMKALRSASPEALEAELKRSKGVNELSQTMINSAKVEIAYLQVTKQSQSDFLKASGTPPAPAAPQLQSSAGEVVGDGKAVVTRSRWVDTAK